MAQTTIYITGQINGNYTLNGAIEGGERDRTQFNGFKIVFPTKKEAVTAIRKAYNYLKSEHGQPSSLRVNTDRTSLNYDASKAEIYNPNI